MSFDNLDLVTIIGQVLTLDQQPAVGTITFTPPTYLIDSTTGQAIFPVPLPITLDENGSFSIDLPATDDPDLTPVGWAYDVEVKVNKSKPKKFALEVPVGTGPLELFLAAPAEASLGVFITRGPQGDPGPAGPAGPAGDLTMAAATAAFQTKADAAAQSATFATLDGSGNLVIGSTPILSAATIADLASGTLSGTLVTSPTGFPRFRRSFNIFRASGRKFTCDYDPTPDRPAAGVTYYCAPGASYLAAGTLGDPCSPRGAHDKADAGTAVLAAGEYFGDETFEQISKNLNIIGAGLDAQGNGLTLLTGYIRPSSLSAWTLQSGNIYQVTQPNSGNANLVTDKRPLYLTDWGDQPVYTKMANLAAITGPGQWAQNGTTVYVWALGDANLITDASFIRIAENSFSGIQSTLGVTNRIFLQGVELQGCGYYPSYPSIQNAGRLLIAQDVRIRYSAVPGTMVARGSAEWNACIRVQISSCAGDGFGYDATGYSGVIPQALEVDCFAHHLWAADPSDVTINSSTQHAGSETIRVNTKGNNTQGPGFADVTGSTSWNLGCETSTQAGPIAGHVGFQALDSTMWLDTCNSVGNNIGINPGGTTGVIYYHNQGPGPNANEIFPIGSGVATAY